MSAVITLEALRNTLEKINDRKLNAHPLAGSSEQVEDSVSCKKAQDDVNQGKEIEADGSVAKEDSQV